MVINDPQAFRKQRIAQMEKVEENLPEEDREDIRSYVDRETKKNELAESTLKNRISRLRILAEEKSKDEPLKELTSTELNGLIDKLSDKRGWDTAYTRNYQKAVRRYLDASGKVQKKERIILSSSNSGGKDDTIDVDKLPDMEDLADIIQEHSRMERDRALFMTMLETGARISAILSRRVKHYQSDVESREGARIKFTEFTGSKGFEGPRIIAQSTPFIERYLHNEHPDPDNEDAPLFAVSAGNYEDGDDNALSPPVVRKRINRLLEGTDLEDKDISPHTLRHVRVTEMRKQGYSDALIKHHLGWSEGSNQIERYSHLDDVEKNKQIAEEMGLEVEDEEFSPALDNCPRCGCRIGSPEWEVCPICKQSLELAGYPDWFHDYVSYVEDEEDDKLYQYFTQNPRDVARSVDQLQYPLGECLLSKLCRTKLKTGEELPERYEEEVEGFLEPPYDPYSSPLEKVENFHISEWSMLDEAIENEEPVRKVYERRKQNSS
jgi:integrase